MPNMRRSRKTAAARAIGREFVAGALACCAHIASAVRASSVFILAACTSKGSTGPATIATDGGANMQVSAWSIETTGPDAEFLIGPSGTIAYLPWQITLGSVPVGTDCAGGTGHGSLRHDASSWLATVEIAVPFTHGDDTKARALLSEGAITIGPLNSGLPPITSPVADVQMFDGTLDVLESGTLTITSFSESVIEGHFEATGTGATTMVSSTFTAPRCEI